MFRARSTAAQLILVQRGEWGVYSGHPNPPSNDLDAALQSPLTMACKAKFEREGLSSMRLFRIFTHPDPEWG
jgi:hypothetical protein